MSAYASLKVRELRRLWVERGLQHHRMNKADLIAALQRVDDGDISASEAASEAGSSDAEIEMGGGANIADGGDGGSVDSRCQSISGHRPPTAVLAVWSSTSTFTLLRPTRPTLPLHNTSHNIPLHHNTCY